MSDTRFLIVTGGSRGIGRAIVEASLARGFDVGFTWASDGEAAAEVVAIAPDRICAHRWDQSQPDGGVEAIDALLGAARRDRIDAFVANAGIIDHAPLDQITAERFDDIMAVNARGTLHALQAAAPRLRDGGRIVCISSVGTVYPSVGEAVYAASKAVVEQIVRVTSRELGARGITVNAVSPGPTDTDMLRRNVPQAARATVASMTALGRLGEPEDVARAVMTLCSRDAGWITGQIIRADGGLT